jgi:hypothetical protein
MLAPFVQTAGLVFESVLFVLVIFEPIQLVFQFFNVLALGPRPAVLAPEERVQVFGAVFAVERLHCPNVLIVL